MTGNTQENNTLRIETTPSSPILYIEPNRNYSDKDNVYTPNEELTMSVDIQVVIPGRTEKNDGVYSYSETDSAPMFSFFKGKTIKVDNGVNYYNNAMTDIKEAVKGHVDNNTEISRRYNGGNNYYHELTTDYTNASYREIYVNNGAGSPEMLCISSIDVKFDPNFVPTVTVKFVDIRGYGLMMPTDYEFVQNMKSRRDEEIEKSDLGAKDKWKKNAIGSFFKAIFRLPYPRFIITIRGYYGSPVTFNLSILSFKTSFDSKTGDFNIVVQFIGHNYGMYSDLPFNILIAAPYISYLSEGNNSDPLSPSSYWKKRVAEGVFKYESGKFINDDTNKDKLGITGSGDIDTYPSFINKYIQLAIAKNEEEKNEKKEGKPERSEVEYIIKTTREFITKYLYFSRNRFFNNNIKSIVYKYGNVYINVRDNNNGKTLEEIEENAARLSFYNAITGLMVKEETEQEKLQKQAGSQGSQGGVKANTKPNTDESAEQKKQESYAHKLAKLLNDDIMKNIITKKMSDNNTQEKPYEGDLKNLLSGLTGNGDSINTIFSTYRDRILKRNDVQNLSDKYSVKDFVFFSSQNAQNEEKIINILVNNKIISSTDTGSEIDERIGHNSHLDKLLSETTQCYYWVNSNETISGIPVYYFFDTVLKLAEEWITEKTDNYENERAKDFVQRFGFEPTISNAYRMLFANIETFTNSFFDLIQQINDDIRDNKRIIRDLGIQKENTDVGKDLSDDSNIPPFPAIYRENNGKSELVYPGSFQEKISEIAEVKYVKAIADAIMNVNAIINKLLNEEALKKHAEEMERLRKEVKKMRDELQQGIDNNARKISALGARIDGIVENANANSGQTPQTESYIIFDILLNKNFYDKVLPQTVINDDNTIISYFLKRCYFLAYKGFDINIEISNFKESVYYNKYPVSLKEKLSSILSDKETLKRYMEDKTPISHPHNDRISIEDIVADQTNINKIGKYESNGEVGTDYYFIIPSFHLASHYTISAFKQITKWPNISNYFSDKNDIPNSEGNLQARWVKSIIGGGTDFNIKLKGSLNISDNYAYNFSKLARNAEDQIHEINAYTSNELYLIYTNQIVPSIKPDDYQNYHNNTTTTVKEKWDEFSNIIKNNIHDDILKLLATKIIIFNGRAARVRNNQNLDRDLEIMLKALKPNFNIN